MTADRSGLLSGIKIVAAILTACMVGGTATAQSRTADLAFNREDLNFVLKQIKIAERHAAGENLRDILPNLSIPWGLRTVDGRFNNLQPGQEGFGQADLVFPHTVDRVFSEASDLTLDPDMGGPQEIGDKTSYASGTNVEDSTPRLISNLIVNQSTLNPAAVHAAAEEDGVNVGPDITGADQFFIPNVATDEGLSAPFNTFITFFGQFFDHGLDLVNKGGNGFVFMRVPEDDALFDDTNPDMNFMMMPRATRMPGLDGIQGTDDDIPAFINATTPHVDQQQTYASHASSQVILRHYEVRDGRLQNTGRLLNWYGNDGIPDNADDGGMATWDSAQLQARNLFGIDLDDGDGNNVPLILADYYGNFIPGDDRGLPQLVTSLDPLVTVEGDTSANGGDGVDASQAIRVNQSFFLDVAHTANPNGKIPDADNELNDRTDMLSGQVTRGIRAAGIPINGQATYDDELLGVHFICGDGRCNENIALTTIHTIFHAEHNRLVAGVQRVVLDTGDLAFLNEWLDGDDLVAFPAWAGLVFSISDASLVNQATTKAAIDALNLDWDGRRLFQASRFGTEMQYNRVVFDEFVPTLSGLKNPFDGFHIDVDPSIVLEFAQSVYRFGHSMLTETVERRDPNYAPITETYSGSDEQLGLFEAFLNPLALYNAGEDGVATITPEQGTGAVIRGLVQAGGNEIDEFVTGGMQNNVVGLPLDLGAINIARGRDVGNPRLNDARRKFYTSSGDPRVTPYQDWIDFGDNLRHELSLINFIAAYGTHPTTAGADGLIGTDDDPATTYETRRAAACGIVSSLVNPMNQAAYCTGHGFAMVQPAIPADALDFLLSRNTWASGADGRATTGLEDIDFWIGGLAEERMPFGGLLGSTHNFVFEVQAEALQNGDRFYYVGRTKGTGLHFFSELESNSFTALVMRNTDLGEEGGSTLPASIFATQNHYLEVDQSQQFNEGYGSFNGGTDNADPDAESELFALIIRDEDFVTTNIFIPDPTLILQYTGGDHVTLNGTTGDDTLIGGIGDDTFWGGLGNDRIEGGDGADHIMGGPGDDIISDLSGPDVIEGGDGHDAIFSGNEEDIIFGDAGNDFIVNSSEFLEGFGGEGDDWFLIGIELSKIIAGSGDDWLEELGGGENIHAMDEGKAAESGEPSVRGNDIYIAYGGNNDMDMEHGDDIMVDGPGVDRMEGQLGFDWASFQNDTFGVNVDLDLTIFTRPIMPPSNASVSNRYDRVEGLSGSPLGDILRGTPNRAGIDRGSELTNFLLIDGLSDLVPAGARFQLAPDIQTGEDQFGWTGGDIIIGGGGSDILVGEAGDDILDGDSALQVGINTPNPDVLNGPLAQALAMAQEALLNAQTTLADLQVAVAAAAPQAAADAAAAAPLNAQAAVDQTNADDAAAAAADAVNQAIALQNAAATATAQAAADAAAVTTTATQAVTDEALSQAAMAQATADATASGIAAATAATAQAASDTAAAAVGAAQAAAAQAATDAASAQVAAIQSLIALLTGTMTPAQFSANLMAATDAAMALGVANTAVATASTAANTAAATASATAAVAAVAATTAANSQAVANTSAATAASSAAAATTAVAAAADSAAAATAATAAAAPAQTAATMAATLAAMVQATADASAAAAAGLQAAADASAALLQALTDQLADGADDVTDAATAVAVAQAAKDAVEPNIVVAGMQDIMGAVFAGLINPGELSKSRIISDHDLANVDTDAALFSGDIEDYTIEADNSGFLVVTDTRPLLLNLRPNRVGNDGIDLVRNVERLVFAACDDEMNPGCSPIFQVPENVAGSAGDNNSPAMGQPDIMGTAEVGETLTVEIGGVTDADNVSTMGAVESLVSWTWEVELADDPEEAGSNFFTPIVRLLGFAGNGDPFQVNGDELELTLDEAGLRVRAQGIFQDEAGVFEIVTSAPVMVDVPAGFVLPPGFAVANSVAKFLGTNAFLSPASVIFENLALSGGNPRQGFGVGIGRIDLALFENTGFTDPISVKDEAKVSNIVLTFTNDADGTVTGTFTPKLTASVRTFPLRVEPNKVNLNFEILGDAISPLVKGPTTASVTVDGVELANATFDGDSSINFGRGVLVTLVNGVPNPALAADGLPRQCQGCSTVGEGEDGEDGVDIPTDTVATSGTVDRRGRIRIRGVCATGRAAAPGLTCETHANGEFDCKGRGLDRGDNIDATCINSAPAPDTGAAGPALTVSGVVDSRGSLRISGTCEGTGEASAPGLRCSTRRGGSFRCSGRGLTSGEVVSVSCD